MPAAGGGGGGGGGAGGGGGGGGEEEKEEEVVEEEEAPAATGMFGDDGGKFCQICIIGGSLCIEGETISDLFLSVFFRRRRLLNNYLKLGKLPLDHALLHSSLDCT